MARKPRLFVTDAIYHVYCRVARGEFVFDDPGEAEAFVDGVRRTKDLDQWKILAWCLMGNHYHFVVRTGAVPLWRSMLRLQSDVARGFNRRRRYLGRLWQSRYRARIIDTQQYLRQVVSYVHLNPVAAGITDDPVDYPHCGHNEVLGKREPRLIDLPAVLVEFGGSVDTRARQEYLEWLRTVAEAKWLTQGIRDLPWWSGSNDIDEITPADAHPEARTFDGRALEDDRTEMDIDSFLRFFSMYSGHSLSELSSTLRGSELVQGRVELCVLAVGRYGFRSTEIAALLGKHPSSLSRWLNTGMRLAQSDQGFRKRLGDLDRSISDAGRNNATMRRVAP